MWFLYLDESGDLGFDFFTKHPSHFLTVCILAVQGVVANVPFEVYAMTLNKRRVYDELAQRKDRVYHFIARQVLDRIPVEDATTRVQLIIDRSKSKREIADFNSYITRQLQGRLDPRVPPG